MATSPIFTETPVIGVGQLSAANTGRDGTGTIVPVISGAANGTRITRVTVEATGTTTAGMVRLFLADPSSNNYLWREVSVTAVSVSNTVAGFAFTYNLPGESALILPSGYSLRAATAIAETFNVIAEGGDY